MSFRKEKKYRLSFSDQKLLQVALSGRGMEMLHPPRVINSCYFDTGDLTLFQDSEEGILPRKKVRIRWYNQDRKLTKEIKISSIEGRFKTVEPHDDVAFAEHLEARFCDDIYGHLKPTLLVSYSRAYYMLDGLRITFDSDIHYTDLRSQTRRRFMDHECVVEAKTPIDTSDDYIDSVINIATSRFSKYSRGLLLADRKM